LGASLHIEVSGAQAYEEVVLLRGVSGLGDGPCPAFLGGACLDLAGAVTRLGSVWVELDGGGALDVPLPARPDLEGRELCVQAVVIRGRDGGHTEVSPPVCLLLGRDTDGDGVPDVSDPCPDEADDACLGPFCEHLGWKTGSADWSCPVGMRMPALGEWDLVEPCLEDADYDLFGYYQDVASSVGGCNCKWNGGWCGQPSIETLREGRMCGDYAQLHVCVE
ncbi:MAG: hypothetical protein ACI8PZ_006210, partial [Myxococcota bacterium]